MGKRKKPKQKKPKHSSLLSTEEESLLPPLLENFRDIDLTKIREQIPSPELARALVERLPADDPGTVNLIVAIRDAFDQKSVRKAMKKAFFRLRQKGISVPDLEADKRPSIFDIKTEKTEPSAYLGPIDGLGSRGVFIALPQIPKGIDIGLGIVNEEGGIIDFFFDRYSKKRMRDVKELFFERVGQMVEASLSHAATILETAYKHNENNVGESARGYLSLRPWILENVSLLERPVIYDGIPFESVSEKILTRSQIDKLFGHKLMESWIIDPERLKSIREEITEAEESPILMSGGQKTNRINEIKEKAIAELYEDSKRSLLKSRLEEMAYIFLKQDEDGYAHLSLAAALSLDAKDSSLRVNSFLMAMLDRSLTYYLEATKEIPGSPPREDDQSSRIIIP